MLSNIRKGTGPCWYCSGVAPLDPEVAVADMRAAGVEPLEPYPGSGKPWRSRCYTCEHEASPTLNNVRSGHHPCKYCSSRGFDGTKSGVAYLFRHDDHHALKVGITNDRIERLIEHEREGWSLVEMWNFGVGADARYVEVAVLDAWSTYDYGVSRVDMPQGGYTETVSLEDVTEAEALALIEAAIAALSETETHELS